MKKSNGQSKQATKYNKSEVITCYAFLALPIIGFLVFTVYPMIWAVVISFFNYSGVPSETAFVGWDKYKTIFTSNHGYWHAWLVNIKFTVFKLPIEMILAFFTANLIMKNTKCAGLYRSVYFLPAIVSTAIVGLIFSSLFDYFGVINSVITKLGFARVDWFANSSTAMAALIVGSLWQSFGINVLYFMAALSTVPKEVLESAEIDGANKLTCMLRISLPMIAPTLQVMLLLSIQGLLNINDYILAMTNGAPAGSTYTISAYMTSKIVAGFGETVNIGYASAMSIVTSIIFCIVGFSFNKLSNKMKNIY